jgi:hypothetical protein
VIALDEIHLVPGDEEIARRIAQVWPKLPENLPVTDINAPLDDSADWLLTRIWGRW